MQRVQHIIASGIVAAVGVWVAILSRTQQPSDAFLFPRLISTVFVALALWTLAKALLGRATAGSGLSANLVANLAPGLAVTTVYVFWAVRVLGFYTASTIGFFTLLALYDSAPHGELRTWLKRLLITAGFLVVMYGLFAILLNVYTPREIFS